MLSDKYKLCLTTSTRACYFPCLHVILVYQMRMHANYHIIDTWGILECSHISNITGFPLWGYILYKGGLGPENICDLWEG